MVFKVGSWKFHGRLVVFLGSSCTIMKYGEMMFYNLFFSSDSNKKCDCKRCFYQTYSNPVNAIVSFCGNSTEVFLRVNFQTAPGLMFFIIRKFILIKNTKSYKSSKLLKVVKQLEEEYDKWFLVIRHVWKNICFWNLYSEFIMYATFYESILQRDGKRIIKKHNYFCYLDYIHVLSFCAVGHSLFASLKILFTV